MPVKYSEEVLKEAVEASESVAGVLRHLGIKQSGSAHAHIRKRIDHYGISTDHFTGSLWSKGKQIRRLRKTAKDILVRRESSREHTHMLRRALLEIGRPEECEVCGLSSLWCGKVLKLQIDHIDGDGFNCLEENLRFICPNCHTQTETHNKPKAYLPL